MPDNMLERARKMCHELNYDQVVIIARRHGDNGIENVTTYGKSKLDCGVAARIGDFLKYKIMNWDKENVQ